MGRQMEKRVYAGYIKSLEASEFLWHNNIKVQGDWDVLLQWIWKLLTIRVTGEDKENEGKSVYVP